MKKLLWLLLFVAASVQAQKYTAQGDFVMPADYRRWVFLSSGIGMTYSNQPNAHPVFDNVFVNPAAYNAFLKTGAWPDKTVFIKENRASDSNASNKDGKFQTKLVGHEAHVKDSAKGGWAFYVIKPDSTTGKAITKKEFCVDCHQQSGSTDSTFVQFYPTLIDAAKKNGTYREPKE